MSKARQLADNGAATPNRNLIINGAMNVAQRSVSETGLGSGNVNVYYTLDRFQLSFQNTAGRLTMTQTADGPVGFENCLKLDCTTADTSIAAGEYMAINQAFESQNCVRIGSGTSAAKEVTVSFYVKGNASATYVVQLLNNNHSGYIHNNRTFAVTTAWVRHEITFQADTTTDSAFDSGATAGLGVAFIMHAGSNFTSATLASDWATGVTNRAAGISSFFDSTDRTFYLTGVQIEVGSSATPFEHKSFAEDLAECQRYYYKTGPVVANDSFCIGFNGSATVAVGVVPFPVTMRAEPTALEQQGTGPNYRIAHESTTTNCNSVPTFDRATNQNGAVVFTVASGLTSGQGCDLRSIENSAFLAWSAEL